MSDETPEPITVNFETFKRQIMSKLSPEQKEEFLEFLEALISLDDSEGYSIQVVLTPEDSVLSWRLNPPQSDDDDDDDDENDEL